MHYIIIGNSAAGINAAETLRELDKNGRITVVSSENAPPYSRCLLSYYLAGELDKKRLFIRDKDWYRNLDISPLQGHRVTSLLAKKNRIVLDDNYTLSYDKLLIASGSSPLFIPIKGRETPGVFGFRTLEDADNIIRFINKNRVRSVAVIGAGFIGLKTACGFQKRKLKVTIVEKLGRLMPRMIDQKASGIFEKEFQAKGIDIILKQGVKEIIIEKNRAAGIRLENNKIIPAQVIIMSVGVKPNIDFLAGTNIKTDKGIIVNEHLQTNIENIFAAGDVAETIDFITGERALNALWPCACAQGKIAAYNMAQKTAPAQKRAYQGSMAMNSVEFFGLPVISFGITNPLPGNGCKTSVKYDLQKKLYRKIVLTENRLVGLISVGNIEKSGVFLSMLKRRDCLKDYEQIDI
ncbi:MAG: NAD(P)/FAD-dependent oxidoreductase [Planctomycetes bacterium]|nr:NAD(P)/FAD-dependent oxidoreductase [Planctomycetota bacterium]